MDEQFCPLATTRWRCASKLSVLALSVLVFTFFALRLAQGRPATALHSTGIRLVRPLALVPNGSSLLHSQKGTTLYKRQERSGSALWPHRHSKPAIHLHSLPTSSLEGDSIQVAAVNSSSWYLLLAALGILSLGAAAIVRQAIRDTDFIVVDRIIDDADESTRLQTAAMIFANDKRPVILYDGVCNLCNTGVNFVLDWDHKGNFRFAALQSVEGRALLQKNGRSPDDISSIVLVSESGCHIKSEAVLRIGRGLGGPWAPLALLAFAVPRVIRDAVYDQVANNRYVLFGQTNSCRLSNKGFEDRFVAIAADIPGQA